jgi:phage virion morphogenesis protein
MAGIGMEVTFNDGPVLDALDRLEAGMNDTTPLMRQIGGYGVRSTQERFMTETAPDGSRWKDLNPAYAEFKGAGPNILTGGGYLKDTMHFDASAREVSWGSPMIYSRVHQFGATITAKGKPLTFLLGLSGSSGLTPVFLVRVRSVTIPARPYLGINGENRQEIEFLAGDYLHGFL